MIPNAFAVIAAFSALCGVALLALRVLRRRVGSRQDVRSTLYVHGALKLGGQQQLVSVRWHDTELLLAIGGGRLELLCSDALRPQRPTTSFPERSPRDVDVSINDSANPPSRTTESHGRTTESHARATGNDDWSRGPEPVEVFHA